MVLAIVAIAWQQTVGSQIVAELMYLVALDTDDVPQDIRQLIFIHRRGDVRLDGNLCDLTFEIVETDRYVWLQTKLVWLQSLAKVVADHLALRKRMREGKAELESRPGVVHGYDCFWLSLRLCRLKRKDIESFVDAAEEIFDEGGHGAHGAASPFEGAEEDRFREWYR